MAECTDLVLLLAADAISGGNVFRRHAHMVIIEDLMETIVDHQVDQLAIAHPLPPSRAWQCVGNTAHGFHTSGEDHIGIATTDGLGGKGNRLDTRGAELVDGGGAGLLGDPCPDHCLASTVLSQAGSKDIAHDDLIDFNRLQIIAIIVIALFEFDRPCIPDRLGGKSNGFCRGLGAQADSFQALLKNGGSEIDDGDILEGSTITADGGSLSGYNDNVSHKYSPQHVKITL